MSSVCSSDSIIPQKQVKSNFDKRTVIDWFKSCPLTQDILSYLKQESNYPIKIE